MTKHKNHAHAARRASYSTQHEAPKLKALSVALVMAFAAASVQQAVASNITILDGDNIGDNISLGLIAHQVPSSSQNIETDETGILLYADGWPDDDGEDSIRTSRVLTNTVSNDYNIAAGEDGIALIADAWGSFANEYSGGSGEDNVFSEVSHNIIINTGSILADDDRGIVLESEANGEDDDDFKIEALISNNLIVNSGSIRSLDWDGIHIVAYADGEDRVSLNSSSIYEQVNATIELNEIINTGDIRAFDDGIWIGARASSDGEDAMQAVVRGNTINNTGRIYAEDDGIQIDASVDNGLALIYGNEIINGYLGRVISDGNAIEIDGGNDANVYSNTITNSGALISNDDLSINEDGSLARGPNTYEDGEVNYFADTHAAIKIFSANDTSDRYQNTVNLNAPSYIAGEFEFNRYANVKVNLQSGPSHSVRWVFSDGEDGVEVDDLGAAAFSTSGAVPWFTNHNNGDTVQNGEDDVYATIDPSAFAAAPNQLADLTSMVSGMANEGLNRTGIQHPKGFWMTARGARMDYKGDGLATLDQDTRLEAGAFGLNRDFGEMRMGVMVGYADSKLKVDSLYSDIYANSYNNRAKGSFAGLHMQSTLAGMTLGMGLSIGEMDHDNVRFINDNRLWWGKSEAYASYDSRWYAPELSLSVPVALTDSVTLTPTLHGRYSVQKFDAYTERGLEEDSLASVDKHTVKMSEVRFGLDLSKKFSDGSSLSGQLGYVQRNLGGDASVNVSMIGDNNDVPVFTRELGAGYASVKWNLVLSKSASLQLDGGFVSGTEGKGGNLGAKLNVDF